MLKTVDKDNLKIAFYEMIFKLIVILFTLRILQLVSGLFSFNFLSLLEDIISENSFYWITAFAILYSILKLLFMSIILLKNKEKKLKFKKLAKRYALDFINRFLEYVLGSAGVLMFYIYYFPSTATLKEWMILALVLLMAFGLIYGIKIVWLNANSNFEDL